jgi:hypothetical protein
VADKIVVTDPTGEVETLAHEPITGPELQTLLAYKRFLATRGYQEAVRCTRCGEQDGTRFYVTTRGTTIEAMVQCRCRIAFGRGPMI